MVFSSLIFCFAFLPANLICYFLCRTTKSRNIVMLLFSLVFYAWGEPVYVLLLILMSLFSWIFSLLIEKSESTGKRRFFLFCAAAVCILSIGYFKYSGFIGETVNSLTGLKLLNEASPALPIGISFYTFQLLTYVTDVYRKDVPAQKSYWRVLLYASLFHQCIAGPIVRYGDIESELTERHITYKEVSRGISRFCCGLAKKSVLANGCGAAADLLIPLSGDTALIESRSALSLFAGMAFYMLQIYLDFSAYSDMAIGMGLMCGFHYRENFNYPYISSSVTEFWRRWHISLGSFFRDYVYIPLGGNKKGKARQLLNLFIVWGLTGLWHGASWNFVLWGLYFFLLIAAEKLFLGKVFDKIKIAGKIYTLAAVYAGWILFRFDSFPVIAAVFKGLFCKNGNPLSSFEAESFVSGYLIFFIICVIASTPLIKRAGEKLREKGESSRFCLVLYNICDCIFPLILLILSALSLVGDSYNPFLYFQF